MNLEQSLNASINEFKQNMLDFCKKNDCDDLNAELASKFISFVKLQVQLIGQKSIQSYFESFDTEASTIVSDGKSFLRKFKSRKEILTILGKVSVNRNLYQHARGGKSIAPLDIKMGVDREYLTPDVKEIVLFSTAHNTPEETSQIIEKCSLFKLHPTTIKRVIEAAGELIEENKEIIKESIQNTENNSSNTGDVLVCSMDGVNVLLNEPGKKKGRPTEKPTKEQQKGVSAYKNAMCGSFSYYNIVKNEEKGLIPERKLSRYIARMPEERYGVFKEEFEKEVKNIGQTKVKILLTDAHKSIMGYLNGNPLFEDFERLTDYFHAAEHLSSLSEAIFGKSNKRAQSWYIKYATILKHKNQGVQKVIRSAEYYIGISKLNKSRLEQATKQVAYFKRNGEYMDYARFIENGWPIGSGVIEAACKSVVKQRMCRSGQRWSRKGGQSVLSLRAYVKSGRWGEFWKRFHQINYRNCA